MTLSRRKSPVGQFVFVATKGAPTKRRVEVYVVDMDACELASIKLAPTLPKKEASVGDTEQIALPKHAAMKGAPTIPRKEKFVLSMEQSLQLAVMKVARTMLRLEEYV